MIDGMLRADLDAPRKQRHTAKRVFARLVDEYQADGMPHQMVRAYGAASSNSRLLSPNVAYRLGADAHGGGYSWAADQQHIGTPE